jgi:hypothetical protein
LQNQLGSACVAATTLLHPYYKLNYIKHVWGGEDEQLVEIKAGNIHTKNWQAEAQRILEDMACHFFFQTNDN